MTSLLQIWLVKYKCPCSAWFPLCQLQFCRKCSQLRCPLCVIEEIDIVFCPNCLENTTITEASQRRYRCQNCQECPSCGNLLGVRSQTDLYYFQCNACQWTSRDLGIPDRHSSNEQWPEPANPMEEELAKVLNLMKGLSTYERLERDRTTQTTKRLSNLGILQNDRYALQNAYNLRKKALNQRPESTETLHLLAPSAEVPELDPNILTEKPDPGKINGLSQILSHPLSGKNGELYPTKVKMNSRRALRCKCCDTMLYKGELSPNVVKPRLQCFAMDSFPEIRISRPIHLLPGQSSAFFITITNNTLHTINLKLAGQKFENDINCVDTSNFAMEMKIPTRENVEGNPNPIEAITGSEYVADPNETNSRILYIRRNRAGICVECLPSAEIKIDQAFALLNFTFTAQSETPNFVFNGEVKIKMDA